MQSNTKENYHSDFILAHQLAYLPSGLIPQKILIEKEGQDYGALSFTLEDKNIKYRVGKTTPTKLGHFVTVWKREDAVTKPHDITYFFDFFIISVRNGENFGQFVFSKQILNDNDIFSSKEKKGKRGIRVYPPWVETSNKQAKKTQKWQANHFIKFDYEKSYESLINAIIT